MRKWSLLLFLAVFFTTVLGSVSAQDLSETFTAGGVSVSHPADWQALRSEGILLASDEFALDDLMTGSPITGENVTVSISPANALADLGLDADASPEEAVTTLLELLQEEADVETFTVGDVPFARAEITSEVIPSDNVSLYALTSGGITLFVLAQWGDEFAEEPEVVRAIIESISYDPAAVQAEAEEAVRGAQPIEYGSEVTGEITDEQPRQLYVFEGSAGDIVTITMEAAEDSELDPLLSLYTAEAYIQGVPIIDNDDGGDGASVSGTDSEITAFELPDDGEYIIEAGRFALTGEYTLTLNTGDAVPETESTGADTAADAEAIAYGDEVAGELTNATPSLLYRFEGSAGDIVTITMEADTGSPLDPLLQLYTAEDYGQGSSIASNDDAESGASVDGLNSEITAFELPEDGEYIIAASQFGSSNGEFTLRLSLGDEGSASGASTSGRDTAVEAEVIEEGASVTGELNADTDSELYTFEGTEGDVVTITMEAAEGSDLDTTVVLWLADDYPSGMPLAINDDAESGASVRGLNSEITEFELPESGQYIIEAGRFGSDGGEYTLTFSVGGGSSASAAQPGEELAQWAADADGSSQFGQDSWSFEQATGEPDTNECGDIATAWASQTPTGEDTLELTYDVAVIPSQVSVYQTYNPGSITSIELANSETGDSIELEDSADAPGNTDCPGVFTVDVEGVDFPVDTVIVNLDQTIGGNWNEIDAVELVGTVPGEEGRG